MAAGPVVLDADLNALGRALVALNKADGLPASSQIALCFVSLPAEVPEWIELVPGGAIAGSDGRAFVNDKPDDFIAMSAKLQRIKGSWAIDFDHQTQLATNPMAGNTAPAAGWITELQNRQGAIWGKVEWTDLGAIAIQNKRYRGISPVFAYDDNSKRALGLLTAALTNNPNLDLVALNARQSSSQQEKPDMDWLIKLLGLDKNATQEQITVAINALNASVAALATFLGVDVKAAVAMNAEELKAAFAKKIGTNDVLVALCAKAGLKADAKAEEILAALQTTGEPDPSKFVPMAAHMALKEKLDTSLKGKPAELVEQALKDGRLLPAQKDWALNYAQRDLDGFKKYIGDTPPMLIETRGPTGKTSADNFGLTDNQLAICRATGVDPKKFAETNGIKVSA